MNMMRGYVSVVSYSLKILINEERKRTLVTVAVYIGVKKSGDRGRLGRFGCTVKIRTSLYISLDG